MCEKSVKTAILCRPVVLEDRLAFGCLNSFPLLKISKSSDHDTTQVHIGEDIFTPGSFYGYEGQGLHPDHLPVKEIDPLLTALFNGESAAIIAYGATGSGKSHFIGTNSILEDPSSSYSTNIPPNPHSALNYIADRLWILAHQRGGIDRVLKVDVSMVEIYREGNQREQLFNLLGFREKITRTTSSSSSSSSTAIWKPVSNKEELLHTLAEGAAIRYTDCNGINLRSSRSHAVITIRIAYTFEEKTVSAKLMLVDLAGSERAAGAMHGMAMAGGGAVAVAVTATTPQKTPIAFAGVQSVQATPPPQQQQQQVSPANTPSSPAPSFSTPMSRLATSNASNPFPATNNNHNNKNTMSRIPRTPASAFSSIPMTAPHTSTLQKQGAGINLGLFHLGRLVESLAQGASQQAGMYRNSELTKLLQPALGGGKDGNGGGCNTLMVGCISPLAFHEERTKTTLEFIAKAGTVKNRVSANVVHTEEREMIELKKKVKELEAVNQALVSELAVCTSRPDNSSGIYDTIITVPNDDEREMMNQASEICVCGQAYGAAASTPVPTAENNVVTEDLADIDDNEKMVLISEEEYRDLINLGRRERDRADGMAALLRHSQYRAEKMEVQVDSLQNQLVDKDEDYTVQCDGIEKEEEVGRERLAITPSNQVRAGEGERGDGTIAAASNRRRRRRESAIGLSAILSLAVTPVVEAADTLRSINVQHDAHDAEDQQQEVEESSTTADLVKVAADISTSISAPSSLVNRRRFTADELCMTQYSHLRPDILTVLKSQIERDHLFLTDDISSNDRRDSEPSRMMRMVSQERENEIAALRLIVATYNEYLGTIEASLTETSDEVIALQSTQQLDLLEAARQKTEYAQRCAAAEAELEDTKDELVVVRKMLAEKEWNDDVTAAAGLSSPSSSLPLSPMAAGLVSLKNKLSNAVSTSGTGTTSLAKSLLKKSVSKTSFGRGGYSRSASSGVSRLLYSAVSSSIPSGGEGGGGGGRRLSSSSSISSAAAYSYSPLGLPVEDAIAASPLEIVADKEKEMLDKENDVVIDLTSPDHGTTTTTTTTTNNNNIHNDAVNADDKLQQQQQPPLQHHCAPPTDMIQVIFPPKGKKGLFDPGNQTVLWRDRVYPASVWAGGDDDGDAWMHDIKLVHPVTNKKSEISLFQWLGRKSSTICTDDGSSMSSRVKTMCHFCTKNPAKPSAVHPEGLRDIKLCEECYEGLDVGNWKRRDIWWGALNTDGDAEEEEERNVDINVDEGWKYCFLCAGTAPGCTDTLVYCDEPECERGFCTGCLWRFTDDNLAAITAEGYKWQCLKCRDSPVANGDGTNEGPVVMAFSSSSFVPTRGGTNGNVSNKFSGANITGGDEENVPPPMQQHQGGGGMLMGAAAGVGGDGKRRRRLIINRVIPASPSEKESGMQQLFGRMEARRGGLSADYAARNPHWKVASQLQQQQPRRL